MMRTNEAARTENINQLQRKIHNPVLIRDQVPSDFRLVPYCGFSNLYLNLFYSNYLCTEPYSAIFEQKSATGIMPQICTY